MSTWEQVTKDYKKGDGMMSKITENGNVPACRPVKLFSFTLIELLVVIAIIAILAAILLPALNSARQRGLAADCISRLKQVGTAIMMYSDNYDGFLPGAYNSGPSKYWSQMLTSENLLPGDPTVADPGNKEVYRCPAIANSKSGTTPGWRERTYGMRYNHIDGKGYVYIALKKVQNASGIMYVIDASDSTNMTQYAMIDAGLAYYRANDMGHGSNPALVHNGMMNTMFLDGHAEGLIPEKLLELERNRWRDPEDKHCNSTGKPNSLYVNDKNFVELPRYQ